MIHDWLAGGGAGVALETCHRVELYGIGSPPQLTHTRAFSGEDAVAHLLRVACGLESVIVGEDEVLHQVRDALRRARRNPALDRRLDRLFDIAIATGRKARSRRTESSGNLAQAAVAWLRQRTSVAGHEVVVGGAGRMGAVLAHSLADAGATVSIASRDSFKAARLARVYGGRGLDLNAGAASAGAAVAVAVALGGPWIELETISAARLPPIADISAPQAVPEVVRRRLNGSFLGIDDLYHHRRPLPRAYIEDAERLIAAGKAEFSAWMARHR